MITRMFGAGIRASYTAVGDGRGRPASPGPATRAPASVVPAHQLGGPDGLAYLGTGRLELPHEGFDVEHGRPVYGVEPLHVQVETRHAREAAGRDAEAVRPHPRPLREHPHLGPVRVRPGPAGARLHVGRIDQMELEDHHEMGEGLETGHRVGPE